MAEITKLEGVATAVVGQRSLTFDDARDRADAIIASLQRKGVTVGSRIVIATANAAACFVGFSVCWRSGCAAVPVDADASDSELRNLLRKTRPVAAIVDDALAAALDRLGADYQPEHRLDALGEWIGDETPVLSRIELDDESPAYLMATSGTTSEPKVVVVSRRALRDHVATLARVFGYRPGARLLHYLPAHHTDGLVHGIAVPMLTGMSVFCPGRFSQNTDLQQVLEVHRPTHMLVVPTMLAMLYRTFAESSELFSFPEFEHLISTAGYLDISLWEKFESHFSVRISNFYGMTETVSGSLYCGPDDATYRRGTLGRPVDVDVRIVDDRGVCVGTGDVGELQIRGAHLMTGYLDDEVSTNAVLDDGWLSTGDLFTLDSDGVLSIVGRKKNVVKRGGVTIYPEDVRRVVVDVDGVQDAEVIGLPDETFGEVLVVAAVVDDGTTADSIRVRYEADLAAERRPDRIELFEALPRGPSGKVRRPELVEAIQMRAAGSIQDDGTLRGRVFSLASSAFSVDVAALDESASPDGIVSWDSYSGMEFVMSLENEFGIRFKTREVLSISDLGSALRVVQQAVDRTAGPS